MDFSNPLQRFTEFHKTVCMYLHLYLYNTFIPKKAPKEGPALLEALNRFFFNFSKSIVQYLEI